MSFTLRNRSLLTVQEYTPREFRYLLDLARDLKRAKYAGTEQQHLVRKEICLIFEKTSTRTRCAFEVACYDQGAHVTYLDPAGSQIGHKESFKDTARVLGRMFDAIEYRGASQVGVEQLAEYAGVPVFNGLTDEYHPTQMLADVMTMREHSDKPLSEIKYAFFGDTRNNMGHSLMIVGCLLGMDVRLCGPRELWPSDEYVAIAMQLRDQSGAALTITENPQEARPFFRRLRELRDWIAGRDLPGINLDVLSMGMSHDFEVAIEEGSTCVRLGSAIFGERYKH